MRRSELLAAARTWVVRRGTGKLKFWNPTGIFPELQSKIKRTREDLIVTEETAAGCDGQEKENTELITNK